MSGSGLGLLINAMTEEVRRENGVFRLIREIPDEILENVVTDSWLQSILLFYKENASGVQLSDSFATTATILKQEPSLKTN